MARSHQESFLITGDPRVEGMADIANTSDTVVFDVPIESEKIGMGGSQSHIEDIKGEGAESEMVFVTPTEKLGFFRAVQRYKYATFLCFLAGLNGWCDGYEQGMSGSIIALTGFVGQFGVPDPVTGKYALVPTDVSLFTSMKNVGAVIGGLIFSWPIDRFGRKFAFYLINLLMVTCCLIEMFAVTGGQWIAARLVDGLAVGCCTAFVNVYVAELAPTPARGALMAFYAFFNSAGGFTGSVGLNVVQQLPASKWRNIIYSQWVLIGLAIGSAIYIPESPRWLVGKGKTDRARKVLERVYGNCPHYDIDVELQRMVMEVDYAKKEKGIRASGGYLDLFKGTNFWRLVASTLPYHFQASVGTPIISIYSAYFFALVGLPNPFDATVATGVTQLVCCVCSIYLIERIGRRTLLLTGGVGCILVLIAMGTAAKVNATGSANGLVALACLWYASFSLTISPVGYMGLSETATVTLRAKTAAVGTMFCQGMSFAYNNIVPICLNAPALGTGGTVLLFVATGSCTWVLIFLIVPETKARSFNELDELFARKIPAWRFSKTETTEDRQRKELAAEATGAPTLAHDA